MFVNFSGKKHKLFQFRLCLNSQITDSENKIKISGNTDSIYKLHQAFRSDPLHTYSQVIFYAIISPGMRIIGCVRKKL